MVEYVEETHTYLIDGVIVPSVTQLLKYKFPNKYKDIPEQILNDKAEYGTRVHRLIEIINDKETGDNMAVLATVKEFDYIIYNSLKQYIGMCVKYNIKPLSQEQIVYNELLAGRYDMTAEVKEELSLIDIKTTAVLDKEYLSWQLSIYNWLGKLKVKKLYCIWLPKKELGKLVEIDFKTDKEIEDLIKEWSENNENNR